MRRAILCFAALACACADPFDPASYVQGLRVLAVRAEPPEVAPGGSTTLTSLAVDTTGAAVQIQWTACTEPAVTGSGVINPACFGGGPAPYLVPLGSGSQVAATIPAVTPSDFGPPDASGGLYLPIVLDAGSASGAVKASYRLRLAQGTTPNHNPALSGMYVVAADGTLTPLYEGTPLAVGPGDQVKLRVEFAAGSAETYQTLVGGTVTEILRASWFATGGSLSEPVTGEAKPDTVWSADEHLPPSGGTVDLWAVGRDERGGTDFIHRSLVMR